MNTSDTPSHQNRKEEQLQVNLTGDIQFKGVTTGLEEYYFVHQALPEIDAASVDLSATLYGKRLSAPLVISSMTGGVEAAGRINRNLAMAAQETGIAMALGSLRAAIDDPAVAGTFRVRDVAPDILLFANLGAVQLNYGYGVAECLKAIELIQADALILHLNPLQEALQPDGDTNFAGLAIKIEQVCRAVPVPVIVKEVGMGISAETAHRLLAAGVAGIDVAGAGGTSWTEGERRRARSLTADRIAAAFSGWGIPTAESIRVVRQVSASIKLIASGGIRTGIDAAKAICLGADAVGIAAPFLKAAAVSDEAAAEAITEITEELRTAMFCIGAGNIDQLKHSPYLQRK